jgi:hypothetical protein
LGCPSVRPSARSAPIDPGVSDADGLANVTACLKACSSTVLARSRKAFARARSSSVGGLPIRSRARNEAANTDDSAARARASASRHAAYRLESGDKLMNDDAIVDGNAQRSAIDLRNGQLSYRMSSGARLRSSCARGWSLMAPCWRTLPQRHRLASRSRRAAPECGYAGVCDFSLARATLTVS